jgi:CzcA family heavy metal efflux pump
MIDALIGWSLRNRFLVLVAAFGILVWGSYEAARMPIDVFPDLTAPTVTVIAEAHGMAPQEVERLIVFPIETALNGAPRVRRVRSSTGVGIGIVWVEFEWGADIYRARQIVAEKLQLAQGALPPDLEPPVLAPVSSIMGEIMFLALTSDRHSPRELKSTADWVIRRRLLAVPGVSQVVPTGGDTKQYQVVLAPERMSAFGVGIHDVVKVVGETNENASAGFYKEGGRQYLIHAEGRVRSLEDIAETVVALRKGRPVLIRDVAEVRFGSALRRGTGSYNGAPAVILGVQKQPSVNTLELTARLDAVLTDIAGGLPTGMKVHRHVFRQADFIEVAVANVRDALRDGALLVVLIIGIFLVSMRATFITVVTIPLALVTAVLGMKWMGATINTMTLGGMAIAVGALVDDAIVDVENVVRRLRLNATLPEEEREDVDAVVLEASKEVRGSIVFSTVIIVLVFLPLFFLSGVEGRLLHPLGFAYVVALTASTVVALMVTPALCSVLLGRIGDSGPEEDGALVRFLKWSYRPFLVRLMPWWKTIALTSVGAFGYAGWHLVTAGTAFLPEFHEGALTVSAVTLPGTSLEQSDQLARVVEDILLKHPEVRSTSRRTGRAELDEHAQDVNASEIDVSLRPGARPKAEFLAALRQDLELLPGTNVTLGQPISHRIDHMLSGTRANIAVKIFGPDLHELRRLARQVEGAMQGVRGVVDLSTEQQADIPFLRIRLQRPAIARYGMTVGEVAEAIETAFYGHEVSRVLEESAAFDLVVKMEEDRRDSIEEIRETLLATPGGARVPLEVLASVVKDVGPNTISRENVQRKIVVMCNVAERALGDVVHDIQRRVKDQVRLPQGYHVEYGGQFESAEEASRTLTLLGIAVVIGILVLLYVAIGSAADALLVMVNLPLALIGGVAGIFLHDGVLSVASMIGFITLFGIATRNGLMMVTHIQHLVDVEGERDIFRAVERGALERLAPILMTALGSALALVPLALSGGKPGSEIQTPMAIVILCGLVSSTFLNMVVVPALYLRFGSARARCGPQAGADE